MFNLIEFRNTNESNSDFFFFFAYQIGGDVNTQ